MAVFKNYNFEYNAQRVDIFRATVVCSKATDVDDFTEGKSLFISQAGFAGVITSSQNNGSRLTLDIVAESWARELRNTNVKESIEFRQVNAIQLIKDHLLPPGWTLEYPEILDTNPRFISYILRNGTFASHIGTIMDVLGLDYTVYSQQQDGTLTKVVKSYFRDDFTTRGSHAVTERKEIANLSVTVDYGKIATSITCLGAESEQGINQVWMDAEMGDWTAVPHIKDIKDCSMSRPEFIAGSPYFWYFPASPNDYTVNLLAAGDVVTIDDERMIIKGVYFLPADKLDLFEQQAITEAQMAGYLQAVSSYVPTGAIVASVNRAATFYLNSVERNVTFTANRNLSNYGSDEAVHAIYDDVLISSVTIGKSKYLDFGYNLPASNGFIWLGSEYALYRSCADAGSGYLLTGLVRGVPTCLTASCEHCGSREALRPTGWSYGCPYGHSDTDLSSYCTLLKAIKTKFSITTNISQCPLCVDNESLCPAMKCPFVKSSSEFAVICPKGIRKEDVQWTQKYQHHKDTIAFPAVYHYVDNGQDVYETYARDSLIHKYGYIPTQISAKGIADIDGLDKLAEGRLRLSAIPIVGQFSLLNYDPWVVPASFFPGDIIEITVASKSRYNAVDNLWYPSYWFDTASEDLGEDWQQVSLNPASWVKIRQKFVIQKTTKAQRNVPEITFGAGDIGFNSVLDYINEAVDATSQRHRNQDPEKIILASESGMAAKVQNTRTGKSQWVRMAK